MGGGVSFVLKLSLVGGEPENVKAVDSQHIQTCAANRITERIHMNT